MACETVPSNEPCGIHLQAETMSVVRTLKNGVQSGSMRT